MKILKLIVNCLRGVMAMIILEAFLLCIASFLMWTMPDQLVGAIYLPILTRIFVLGGLLIGWLETS